MATYNGAAYIEEQVISILEQLSPSDELIVVDDDSKDDTIALIERFGDGRISLHRNERNRGHVFSFQKAIGLARNPVILFADQDDRWIPGRARLLSEALQRSGALVVSSNCSYMAADGSVIDYPIRRLRAIDSRRYLGNLLGIFAGRASYYGCAMGVRKELSGLILPMPRFAESHDLWIALTGNLIRSNVHLDADTIVRRIHGKNLTSSRRSLIRKLRTRLNFLLSLIVLIHRYLTRRGVRAAFRSQNLP